uniref:Phosphatidylserine decarboxylase n=1 Tax=Brassica oleracea var. oleracea TaxID=109376 RepID=A0A0D3EAY5_BRAOL
MEFYVSTLGKRTSKTCCPSQKRRRKSTNEFKQVSPVDGTVLRFGELKESRGMNEQVKGHSYSAPGLLGTNSPSHDKIDKSWLRISLASPKLRESISASPMKGIYYCVIYLRPGDYHRIHSPADWNALVGVFNMGSTVAVQTVPQITDSVESSNTTPQAAWQIAQPPASGTNPMDGATKGMDVDQPTPPSFGDEEKSL